MTPEALERSTKWLAQADLRPTRQRLSLATLLVGDGQDRHVTAEGLHASSVAAGEKVSLATVYKSPLTAPAPISIRAWTTTRISSWNAKAAKGGWSMRRNPNWKSPLYRPRPKASRSTRSMW